MTRDLISETSLAAVVVPVSMSATTLGGGVDRRGWDAVLFEISFGALAGVYTSTDKWTITLEESAAATSGFAAIADAASVQGTMESAATGIFKTLLSDASRDAVKSKVHRIIYQGLKRYCTINFVKAASGPATLVSVTAIRYSGKASGDTVILPDYLSGNNAVAIVASS